MQKIVEFETRLNDLGVEEIKSVTFFDRETGDVVLHWDYDSGGDATSENTD